MFPASTGGRFHSRVSVVDHDFHRNSRRAEALLAPLQATRRTDQASLSMLCYALNKKRRKLTVRYATGSKLRRFLLDKIIKLIYFLLALIISVTECYYL